MSIMLRHEPTSETLERHFSSSASFVNERLSWMCMVEFTVRPGILGVGHSNGSASLLRIAASTYHTPWLSENRTVHICLLAANLDVCFIRTSGVGSDSGSTHNQRSLYITDDMSESCAEDTLWYYKSIVLQSQLHPLSTKLRWNLRSASGQHVSDSIWIYRSISSGELGCQGASQVGSAEQETCTSTGNS
ncbi:hypothetical protein BC629DRAFT_756132 [Irpex lacteus]|nr:hypothetical protein BC629DRAFT_756132 [Irpex lacteus]